MIILRKPIHLLLYATTLTALLLEARVEDFKPGCFYIIIFCKIGVGRES